MSDGIKVNAGTGARVATDEVTRNAQVEQQQIVKLSLGVDGVSDLLLDSGQQTMTNSLPVVIASNQSTLPVSDAGGSLTVDDGGTTLTVDGTVAAEQSGTWTITSVSTVSNITPGTAAADLGKAEDAIHTSGDVGVMALGVENTDLANLSSTDKDYTPIAVSHKGVVLTYLDRLAQNADASGLLKAEDTAAGDGDAGVAFLAKRTDAPATSTSTDGNYTYVIADSSGALYTTQKQGNEAVFNAMVSKDATFLTGTFQTAVDLPNGTRCIWFDNQTDGDVIVSFDGGTHTHFSIPPGAIYPIPLQNYGLSTTATVAIKDGTIAASTGSFNITSVA